jgi:hypothetical protein
MTALELADELDKSVLRLHAEAAAEMRGMHERIQILYEQLGEAERGLNQHYKMGMEAEREACAKVVENYCGAWSDEGYALAASIRARGQA